MTDDLRPQIEQTIRKMLYPSPFMHWMEGLTNAERVGRIKRSKQSTLRYGLQRFIQSQLATVVDGSTHKLTISPMDDEVVIEIKPADQSGNLEFSVDYPLWLRDFLEEEDNFALLLPDCDEKIGEVLQRIYEWCMEHPPYDLLVRPA